MKLAHNTQEIMERDCTQVTANTVWDNLTKNGTITLEAFRLTQGWPRKAFHQVANTIIFEKKNGKRVPQPRARKFFKRRGGSTYGLRVDMQQAFFEAYERALKIALVLEIEFGQGGKNDE